MKTNVSIKFNSIEEYREIEKKLEELGYVNDKEWNESIIDSIKIYKTYYCNIGDSYHLFSIYNFISPLIYKTYNSLEEFLKD